MILIDSLKGLDWAPVCSLPLGLARLFWGAKWSGERALHKTADRNHPAASAAAMPPLATASGRSNPIIMERVGLFDSFKSRASSALKSSPAFAFETQPFACLPANQNAGSKSEVRDYHRRPLGLRQSGGERTKLGLDCRPPD